MDVSDQETLQFLSGIVYRYARSLFARVCELYSLTDEQQTAILERLFQPGDWQVKVLPPILPSFPDTTHLL